MVGAAVCVTTSVWQTLILLLILGEVAVERAEVADVEAHLVVDVPGTTATYAVAITSKRCVLLVAVGQTIVGALSTTANSKLFVDVVLYTSQNLVGAMCQFLLTVASHLGVLIVEEMVLQCTAQLL